jgi:hypothetical protein
MFVIIKHTMLLFVSIFVVHAKPWMVATSIWSSLKFEMFLKLWKVSKSSHFFFPIILLEFSYLCFMFVSVCLDVATLLWPSVGVKPNTWKKVRSWSPSGLPNVQSSTARPKTPCIGVFLVSLERSWSLDIENGLALAIWTSVAQVMGKRRAGSQTDSRPPKVGNRPLPDLWIESAIRRWKDDDEGYKFGLDLVTIRFCSRELWAPKVPGLHPRQFRDSNLGVQGKRAIWM